MSTQVLDAREVYCPDLFLVMRRFINSHSDEKFIQIVTNEPRARKRLEQYCASYPYRLHESDVETGYCFMVERVSVQEGAE